MLFIMRFSTEKWNLGQSGPLSLQDFHFERGVKKDDCEAGVEVEGGDSRVNRRKLNTRTSSTAPEDDGDAAQSRHACQSLRAAETRQDVPLLLLSPSLI